MRCICFADSGAASNFISRENALCIFIVTKIQMCPSKSMRFITHTMEAQYAPFLPVIKNLFSFLH
jgi:hypothetical protein